MRPTEREKEKDIAGQKGKRRKQLFALFAVWMNQSFYLPGDGGGVADERRWKLVIGGGKNPWQV